MRLIFTMPLTFPTIKPNYCKAFGLPEYNTLIKEFNDGGEARFQLSEIGAGAALSLKYELIDANDTADIISFYTLSYSSWLAFTLPSVIISHPDLVVEALADLKTTTFWIFSEPPEIKPQWANSTRGLYNIEIKLGSVVS